MSATIATTVAPTTFATAAELHERLGGIPLERIRVVPPAGMSTEKDLLRILDSENKICELIDGVLVEKTMGYYESMLAASLIVALGNFVKARGLGIVLGPDGTLRILHNQIRVPDIAFLSWEHFPGRVLPAEPVPAVAPDLAVEVLSAGNTAAEMNRKLEDYFTAGVKLVWFIEPASETATVYEGLQQSHKLSLDDSLDGGHVLPGFKFPLEELFSSGRQQ